MLARVERNGHLSPTARRRAAAAPLGLRPGVPATAKEGTRGGSGARSVARPEVPRAPWFVSWVLDQLLDPADHRFDVLGTSRRARTDMVFTGGLRIITTVDLGAQAAAERAVASVAGRGGRDPYGALVAVEPGTGRSGPWSAAATGGATPASAGSTWPPGMAAAAGPPGPRSRRSRWWPPWSRGSRPRPCSRP